MLFQKSEHRPLRSQSPNRVGSGNLPPLRGPPHSGARCSKDGDVKASTNISSCSISSSSSESISPQAATRTFSTLTSDSADFAANGEDDLLEFVSSLVSLLPLNQHKCIEMRDAELYRRTKSCFEKKKVMRKVVLLRTNESIPSRRVFQIHTICFVTKTSHSPPAILSSHDEKGVDRTA